MKLWSELLLLSHHFLMLWRIKPFLDLLHYVKWDIRDKDEQDNLEDKNPGDIVNIELASFKCNKYEIGKYWENWYSNWNPSMHIQMSIDV